MISIDAYYNGREYVPLGNSYPKKNQKVIITVLDEFMSAGKEKPFRKYTGKLDSKCAQEILHALVDCEKVDVDEW